MSETPQESPCECGGPQACCCNPDTCTCARCWGETPQDHPNVRAIATGTISGAFREWPRVQPEAKALLAERDALREKQCHHGWRGIALREAISTPCPSCGLKSLFIGIGGGLTCASLRCKSPSVEATWEAKDAERDALRQKLAEAEAEHPTGVCLERGLRSERDKLRRDLDRKDHEVSELRAEVERADKAQAALLRLTEALWNRPINGVRTCLLCAQYEDEPHREKCPVPQARAALRDTAPPHPSTEAEALAAMGNDQRLTKMREIPMNEWKKYRKTATQEMRPYVAGEDVTSISVNTEDTLEPGGMIARNATNPKDQWYVAKKFFEDNYEPAW